MLSTSAGSAAVEVSGCLGPHPQTVSSTNLVSSEQLPNISTTLPVNVGYSESPLQTQSEMKCEFQLPECCSQNQGSELMEHTHTVQEFPQANDTESDLSVEIETLNINFPKDVPLTFVRNVASKHRTGVHVQSEFGLAKFVPETTKSTKPCHMPVNVSEVDLLLFETSVKTPEQLLKPRMTNTMAAQTERGLLSHEHTGLMSPQVASGAESVNYDTNPEDSTVESENLQAAASDCTETAVSRGGSRLETGVEQVISEVSAQENLLETTPNFELHSELKAETHVNILTVVPHEETVIELLPRKKTGKIFMNNDIRASVEQGADSKTFESSTNLRSPHATTAATDLTNSIPKSVSPDKMGKRSLMSPTSPVSVKQENATMHSSKLEDKGDYKWPDEPFFLVAENMMMPIPAAQLETTDCGDSKWCDVWPTDSVYSSHSPEERECLLSPTNCFADDAQNDKKAVQMLVHESDFDDDGSRHSLHEIEESIDQLVSDVEMDETQLLKHLSCFQNPVVMSSDAHENDDVISEHLESESSVSSTAVTESQKPWRQGRIENSRPVRAEVKLLVKTCDTGREEIEIRSVKEYWDTEVAHGQGGSSDLKPSTFMLESFQEQIELPQNFELPAKNTPVKLMQSSSEFTNDERVLRPHELSQNESKLKRFENIQLGSDLSKNVEPVSSLGDSEGGYTSQRWQDHITNFFHLPHDNKLLDDAAMQKQKTSTQAEQDEKNGQHIQRLFIRSPDLTLSEPLNMLPSDENMKQQSSAANMRAHEIKKLLVRSPNFEDFITFPIVTPPPSLPSDLKPLSIIPTPPPQHLPKTKLFENLPKVPLASHEDLRSLSPLSQNISPKDIFFSFLPIDDISDIPDDLNSCPSFAQWLSMPSVAVTSSSTILLRGTAVAHPLTRAVSMPSLQYPVCPIGTELDEARVSSYHLSDAEDEQSQTNSLSSVPVPVPRSDTLPVFGQPNSSVLRSSGFSRSHHMKFFSSPSSSSSSSLHTEVIAPHMSPNSYQYNGRKSPNAFNSMSLNNCPSLTTTSRRSSGSPRQCDHKSDMNTLTCARTILSNTQGELDPWYLQTEFLLSPLVIPSGYCTWVPTPDQQRYSRGKEGVNFEVVILYTEKLW
jgi:hypothetical protein